MNQLKKVFSFFSPADTSDDVPPYLAVGVTQKILMVSAIQKLLMSIGKDGSVYAERVFHRVENETQAKELARQWTLYGGQHFYRHDIRLHEVEIGGGRAMHVGVEVTIDPPPSLSAEAPREKP